MTVRYVYHALESMFGNYIKLASYVLVVFELQPLIPHKVDNRLQKIPYDILFHKAYNFVLDNNQIPTLSKKSYVTYLVYLIRLHAQF